MTNRYEALSDRARWFLNNFDEVDLADLCAGQEASNRVRQEAIDRVRALHRKATHGATCVYCAHGQRLGYDTDWPCDTIRALDPPQQQPATRHDDGPTVEEAAKIDRNWDVEKAGE